MPASGTFLYGGAEHPYYREYDGDPEKVNPAVCERTVELPIGYATLRPRLHHGRCLEVGNTLAHWYPDLEPGRTRDVVDKFEQRPGVINEDIVAYSPDLPYDLVISLSTLEHVGKPEYGDTGGDRKAVAAVLHCVGMLSSGGVFLATIPLGWNAALEDALLHGELQHIRREYMVRLDETNRWAQAESYEDVTHRGYGHPWPYANAICILTARN